VLADHGAEGATAAGGIVTAPAENVAGRRPVRYPRCTHIVNTHVVHLLTCAEYDDLLATARGCCMLCWRSDAPLCIDHDHQLGPWAVRGLLCRSCNSRLIHVDSGAREATVGVAEYLANPWHLRQPGSVLKQARMRPRAECDGCGRDVAVRPDGGPWHHWLRAPGDPQACPSRTVTPWPVLAAEEPRAPAPAMTDASRMDADLLAWARAEAKRRGQPFGDFMDGLITAERDRVADRKPAPAAARQEQPEPEGKRANTREPESTSDIMAALRRRNGGAR